MPLQVNGHRAGKGSGEDGREMLALQPGHFRGNGDTAGGAGDQELILQQSCSEPWLPQALFW